MQASQNSFSPVSMSSTCSANSLPASTPQVQQPNTYGGDWDLPESMPQYVRMDELHMRPQGPFSEHEMTAQAPGALLQPDFTAAPPFEMLQHQAIPVPTQHQNTPAAEPLRQTAPPRRSGSVVRRAPAATNGANNRGGMSTGQAPAAPPAASFQQWGYYQMQPTPEMGPVLGALGLPGECIDIRVLLDEVGKVIMKSDRLSRENDWLRQQLDAKKAAPVRQNRRSK